MAHFSREVSWPDSDPPNENFYFGSSSSSDSASSDGDPDFVIPRQGARLYFDAEFTALQRIQWQSSLVGALIDTKPIPTTCMQEIIDSAWSLQAQFMLKARLAPIISSIFPTLKTCNSL